MFYGIIYGDIMIRQITKQDKDEVIKLMKKFYNSDAVLHPVCELNFSNTVDEAINESPYVKIFVKEIDNEITGYCQVSLSYSNEVGGICVYIEELMVKDKFQNLGIGKEFLKFVFSHFTDAKRFRLEVTKNNKRAISLYEKTGFKNLDYIQMIIDK